MSSAGFVAFNLALLLASLEGWHFPLHIRIKIITLYIIIHFQEKFAVLPLFFSGNGRVHPKRKSLYCGSFIDF